jgi:hypothetical protein
VYAVDAGNYRIQKFTSDGTFLTAWGSPGWEPDRINWSGRLVVDAESHVYHADQARHRIQKFTSDGDFLTAWGSRGIGEGQIGGLHPEDRTIAKVNFS